MKKIADYTKEQTARENGHRVTDKRRRFVIILSTRPLETLFLIGLVSLAVINFTSYLVTLLWR